MRAGGESEQDCLLSVGLQVRGPDSLAIWVVIVCGLAGCREICAYILMYVINCAMQMFEAAWIWNLEFATSSEPTKQVPRYKQASASVLTF